MLWWAILAFVHTGQKIMQKTKNGLLLITSLAAVFVFCFSVALAKGQEQNAGQINAAEHQSAVSTFVKSILKVADKESGIGKEVKAIAKEQDEAKAKVAEEINKIQNRNKIKTFFIGTDYKNAGQLRSEMVKTRNRLEQLNKLMEKAKSAANKTTLQAQIQTLEQERTKIDDFLKANEGKFSLFGWLVKLFNK